MVKMPATTDDVRVERYKLFGLILTARGSFFALFLLSFVNKSML